MRIVVQADIKIRYLFLKGKWEEIITCFYPWDKSFSALVTALQLLCLTLGGGGLKMGWQGLYQQPKKKNCEYRHKGLHLTADVVDVLLNLGHPLPEDSEQLGNGGAWIQKNLSALRLTGVKEGELCRWWERETKKL